MISKGQRKKSQKQIVHVAFYSENDVLEKIHTNSNYKNVIMIVQTL